MPMMPPGTAVLMLLLPLWTMMIPAVAALLDSAAANADDICNSSKSRSDAFAPVRCALELNIKRKVFPGCVALVGTTNGTILFQTALGKFVYPGDPLPPAGRPDQAVTQDSIFDLASLTKVIATTSAVALLYQRGYLHLDEPVYSILGPDYASRGKESILVHNLLLHNAGLPPDPVPNFWTPEFGCPQTLRKPSPLENFSCQERIYRAVISGPSTAPVYPVGSKFSYSDLSMITLMYVIGARVKQHELVQLADLRSDCAAGHAGGGALQCWYEAFVRVAVLSKHGMNSSQFLLPASMWANTMPTWNDTLGFAPPGGPPYRRKVMQGQVCDGNAYALGGIAGHAGLFSTANDLFKLLTAMMQARSHPAGENQPPWAMGT
jgi:CubicO group peptidase (beta-lactamase class C family)